MKIRRIFIVYVFLFFVLAAPSVSFAKESAGLVPGDFFYFLDRFTEKISLAITKNSARKAEKTLQYAEERFEELQTIVSTKNADTEKVEQALDEYKKGLELASNISLTIEVKEQKKDVLVRISDLIVGNKKILEGQPTTTPASEKEATEKILAVIGEQESIAENNIKEASVEDERSKKLLEKFYEKRAEQEKIRLGLKMGTSSEQNSKRQDGLDKEKTEYGKIVAPPAKNDQVEIKKEKVAQTFPLPVIPATNAPKIAEKAEEKKSSTSLPTPIISKGKFDPVSVISAIVKLKCFTKEDTEEKEPLPSRSGTGISLFIDQKHYILTGNHIVTNYGSANGDTFYGCEVRFSDGIVYYAGEADLFNLKTSRADIYPVNGMDIALLTLVSQGGYRPKNLPVAPSQFAVVQRTVFPDLFKTLGQTCSGEYPIREPKEGEKHYVFSFPAAATSYRAIIQEGITSERTGADATRDFIGIRVPFVTSAVLDLGSSGGAVVSDKGCLIGVASSVQYGKLSYLSDFMSSTDILNFIQNAQTKPESMLFSRIRNNKKIAEYYKIQDAVDSFIRDMGENKMYPQSLSELVPKYLPTLPKDVLTGKDYPYAVTKNRLRMHMGVSLEESGLLLGLVDEGFLNKDVDFNSKSDSEWERGFDGSDKKGCLEEQNPSLNPNLVGIRNATGLVCYDNVFKIRDKNECFNTAESYRGTNDPKTCYCSSFAIDYFWDDIWGGGNGPYTDDSNICQAAVHAGVITKDGGNVTIVPTAGCDSYLGVTKNGITSKSEGAAWPGSYYFYFEGQQSSCNKQSQSSLLSKDIIAGVYSAIDVWRSFLQR